MNAVREKIAQGATACEGIHAVSRLLRSAARFVEDQDGEAGREEVVRQLVFVLALRLINGDEEEVVRISSETGNGSIQIARIAEPEEA